MMYYRISKNEKTLFFGKKKCPGVGSDLKIICTDSTEILFSKLRSAGLSYHLPKCMFFTFPKCVGYLISIAY